MPLALKDRAEERARKSKDPDDFRAPLHAHLDELRIRIFRILAFVVAGWVIGWFLMPFVNTVLLNRCMSGVKDGAEGVKIQSAFINVPDAFLVLLKQSFVLGLCMALPFGLTQIWGFVAPALKESEKKPVKTGFPISVGLFFLGAGFCWLILPAAYGWFAGFLKQFPDTTVMQNPEMMVTFAIKMMAAFGVCFQLPLIVYILGRIGILSPETLMQYWRQAVVAIFFIAGAITPSNDPASMLMMAVPLCILFAISVYAVKLTTKRLPEADIEMLD